MKNLEIYKWICRAKRHYINHRIKCNIHRFNGMCFSFACTNTIYPDKFLAEDIIPEFNPKFLNGEANKIYWWPVDDTTSRLKAFNTLLSIYWKKLSFKQKLKAILYKMRFVV